MEGSFPVNREELFYEIAYCETCEKEQPINKAEMIHRKTGHEVTIVYCAVCDMVLNTEEDTTTRTVPEQWLIDRGYEFVCEIPEEEKHDGH